MQTGVTPAWPGLRGAYAGMASALAGRGPFWASFYWGYSIGSWLKWDDSEGAQLFAGAVGGAVSSLVMTPVDAIKVGGWSHGRFARPFIHLHQILIQFRHLCF